MPSASPHVLQVFNAYLEQGGEEAFVHGLPELLGPEIPSDLCEFSSADWKGSNAPNAVSQALCMIHNPHSIRRLRDMQAACGADVWVLHNVFPVGSAGIYREAKRQDIPLIYYIHNYRPFSVNGYLWANGGLEPAGLRKNFWPEIRAGAWQQSILKTGWFAAILQMMHLRGDFQKVRVWIAISDFMRDRFVRAGIPEERIVTLRHAWHISQPVTADPEDTGAYLFLGRLSDMKGIRVLLEAWEVLRKQLGPQCPRLIIAGSGPMEAIVRTSAEEHPYIEYRGVVAGEEKRNLLASCRALVVPSMWWEPLGLVAYEAYEFQKPVLAARSGGLAEIVTSGETGILHDPGNVAQLTDQVLSFEKNPEEAAALGRRGRKWLEAHAGEHVWRDGFSAAVRLALRG